MVSIVIVSHSARLADGVLELAQQMTQGKVPMAAAGGIDDPENPIGTDPIQVMEAIQAVHSDDGVVVLMDLGSALLSADMALEFLPDEQRDNIHLCAAPLVEGAVAAAVQAMVGGSVAEVMAEAEGALSVKITQLKNDADESLPPSPGSNEIVLPSGGPELTLVIRNHQGLHARPAARLVSTANQFTADIIMTLGAAPANAKSINQVATLGVRQGDTITLVAEGPDATAALEAIRKLASENFGESLTPPVPEVLAEPDVVPLTVDGVLAGIGASPGIAIGPAVLYRPRLPEVETRQVNDTAAEWQRLLAAIEQARHEIEALHRQSVSQVGAAEAAIFEAHALVLQDPSLLEALRERIESQTLNAEAAWQQEMAALAGTYRAMDSDLMRARAADIEDVGQRVLRQLMEAEWPSLELAEPSILIAADLTPSDTAGLNPDLALAVCTELGGATAHSAILARALGIPAVVGLGEVLWQAGEGDTVAVDGTTGQVWLQPTADQLADLQEQRDTWLAQQKQAREAAAQAAVTRDGRTIEIAANIAGHDEVGKALEAGAEGVGLFRTEFLFMDREQPPSEEEQLDVYRQVARALGERPLIIRTLDVGGDKPIAYLDLGEEANPFLGWRGVRYWLDRPQLHRPQMRAILRAGAADEAWPTHIHIMFPMISTVDELRRAKEILADVAAELRAEGIPLAEDPPVGVMIEVPAAVAIADQLATESDFFSIGTNDLTQYTMAADRGNSSVSALADALQPAVLRLIKQTADAAHEAGIWAGMCGELAGDPLATPLLVGLGLDELSMSAPSIPAVKEAVRRVSYTEALRLADEALEARSVEEVRAVLQPR